LNNFAKVSRSALDLWTNILAKTPNSRLILYAPPGAHLQKIRQRMDAAGVDAGRLQFVWKQPDKSYLEQYAGIDIALDPFPFPGGVTTCEALWMGVPVITLSGKAGPGGKSILANLGLGELAANSKEQYAEIAIKLAGDLRRLLGLRSTLRARFAGSPLTDARRFARNIEAIYREMWRSRCVQ
jgi:predicted O-linked N-acetylglucosamine transferase (SPINDLY family)